MKKRQYGRTGLDVTEIGFGAWQLGNAVDWDAMSERAGIDLVHRAIDLGCNFFDTAPNYGLGASESILGSALKGYRDEVVINTKCGHHPDDIRDFDIEKIGPSIEQSLKKLNTDHLDSVILHNPPFKYLGQAAYYELFEKFKQQGKILAYGASVSTSEEILKVLDNSNSDIIQVRFNIFYQEPAAAFEVCRQKEVAIIANLPLDNGWLSGRYNRASRFDDVRSRWPEAVIDKRASYLEKIDFLNGEYNSMIHAALQFILSFEAVTTVIPGNKNAAQLEHNLAAAEGRMSSESFERLKSLWRSDFERDVLPW